MFYRFSIGVVISIFRLLLPRMFFLLNVGLLQLLSPQTMDGFRREINLCPTIPVPPKIPTFNFSLIFHSPRLFSMQPALPNTSLF